MCSRLACDYFFLNCNYCFFTGKSRDSITSILSRLLAWWFGGSNPGKDKSFYSSSVCPHWLYGPSSLLSRTRISCPRGVKQWGHEANHSPPSSAETKSERSYPSPFLGCLRDACRDKFAFDTDGLLYCNVETELMILLLSLLERDEAWHVQSTHFCNDAYFVVRR